MRNHVIGRMQEASGQQVRAGLVPASLAAEGVRMRYLMDARIDCLLADVYRAVTRPPLLINPFGKVMSLLRSFGCQMEVSQVPGEQLVKRTVNRLAKVGPAGSFVYAGVNLLGS